MNTTTGKTEARPVGAVLVNHDTNLYDLQIRAGSRTSVIHTTSNHPFYIPGPGRNGGRWIKAGALRYGIHLRTPVGGHVVVDRGWIPSAARSPPDHRVRSRRRQPLDRSADRLVNPQIREDRTPPRTIQIQAGRT